MRENQSNNEFFVDTFKKKQSLIKVRIFESFHRCLEGKNEIQIVFFALYLIYLFQISYIPLINFLHIPSPEVPPSTTVPDAPTNVTNNTLNDSNITSI